MHVSSRRMRLMLLGIRAKEFRGLSVVFDHRFAGKDAVDVADEAAERRRNKIDLPDERSVFDRPELVKIYGKEIRVRGEVGAVGDLPRCRAFARGKKSAVQTGVTAHDRC